MKDASRDQIARERIAAEVRAELARQRISVSEAARRLGWGQSVLQRRIVAERPFEAEELAALAELLDVPVQTFFDVPKRLNIE
jgi:hypothetical protein